MVTLRISRQDRFDLPDEPVATPRQCFDEFRLLGGIAQRLTHFLDGRIQAVLEVDKRVGLPKPFAQVVAGDQLAWTLEQRDEDLSGLFLKRDPLAIAEQVTRCQVQLETSEANARLGRVGLHGSRSGGSVAAPMFERQ